MNPSLRKDAARPHGDPGGDRRGPPGAALRLADRFVHPRMRDAVVGDLVESFSSRFAARGSARARAWFWGQVLLAIAHFPPRLRRLPATGDGTVTGFLDDLARAARTLRRAPAFTLACAVTLGIGIGAATAIFSVADPVMLRPLPYDAPDRIDIVSQGAPGPRQSSRLGYETIADIRDQSQTLEHVAAIAGWQPILVREGAAAIVTGLSVSSDYFATLGVRPALGRDFRAEEDVPTAGGVVILSHAFWMTRFGGDSSLIGGQIDFGTRKMTVAGVMPAGFDDVLQPGTQIWRVLRYGRGLPYTCRTCQHLQMIARRKPGVTEAQAVAELNVLSARMVAQYPKEYESAGFALEALQHAVVRPIAPALVALLVAVALLLTIATVNVGGLQLARALQRDEEFAVRTALGAGAGRLTRLLVAEGIVLAAVAGAAGWLVATVGLRELVAHLPAGVPRMDAIHLDLRAFGFAMATTLTAGLAIGLIPAWHARRRALAGSLRGSRRVGGAPHRMRAALVVTEVALAVILLAGAGLLARSLSRLLSVDAGVAIDDVATLNVQVSGSKYATNDGVWAWQEQLVDLARAVPGVASAAMTSQLPLGGGFDSYGIQALDKPLDNPEHAPSPDRYTVTPGFLRTMRVPVLDGRDFTSADDAPTGAPVVIVSQALAQHIWPGESAIGKQVHMGEPSRPWFTVVGVAGNVHHRGLDVGATEQVYIPTRRWFFSDNAVDVVVRTTGDPAAVLPALRRAALEAEPLSVISRLAPMHDVVATSTAQRRLALSLFTVFAGIALLLATAGIVGALSGMVAERTREIGLRSALGATPAGIMRLVLGRGLALAGGGAIAGIVVAVAGSRLLESLLFGVGPRDVTTYAAVSVGALLIGGLASAFPAWRAILVDPITALRSD